MKKKNVKKSNRLNIPQIMRMAFIDIEISRGNFPGAEKLSKEYQVSTKTIKRTIEFMKTFYNAPIKYDRKINGYYYTDKKFKLLQFDFDDKDLHTLALLNKAVKISNANPFDENLNSFFNKIYFIYKDRYSIQLKDVEDNISFRIRNTRIINNEIFVKLNNAITDCETLECLYRTAYTGRTGKRMLDPYHIVNDKGEWYLIGFCHKDKMIKLFSVSRFESVELCGLQFTPEEKFDVDKFFEDSFGIFNEHKIIKVKIYFEKGSASYVKEKIWHSSQVIKENPDGSIILEMKVNGSSEIKHWILSWGKNCILLSPKKLVTEIKNDLSTALKKYE